MTASPGSSPRGILIIVQNLPVPFDRRVWMEATTLREAGYDVAVVCPKKKMYTASYERLDGIDIYRYPLLHEADRGIVGYLFEFVSCWIETLFLAVKAYWHRPFHVIHACNPPDTYFALASLFRPFGVKFVFDHHDLSPEMYLAKGGKRGGLLHAGLLKLERWTMRSADLVIAVNESHRDIALQRGGIPANRLAIVRSGPRSAWVGKSHVVPSLKNGKKFLVMYLGEMCAQDGVDLLLQSISTYVRRWPDDTRFVLVGGGPEQKRLAQLAADLGLDGSVAFTGRISDEMLWEYLSTADVCVDPDPFTEWSNMSTMNKMIEYMAFGKPIVAFDLREHRRTALDAAVYVKGNDTGTFAATIRELLDSPERRVAMSALGQDRFQHVLAWEESAKILLDAYKNIL